MYWATGCLMRDKGIRVTRCQRLLEVIGNRPPAEVEAAYHRQIEHTAWAAGLNKNGLWNTRGGSRPDDEGWDRGTRPVINVFWEDAQSYVSWLSSQTGEAYRLLSQAEWEYVARAGTQTAYSWGNSIGSNRANCDGCGSQWDDRQTAPVGAFSANAFGVHDMHGNVWDWVEDCSHESYSGAPTDGSAWLSGNCDLRESRGGSWLNASPWYLRSANRNSGTPPGTGTTSSGSVWPGRSPLESLHP